MIVSNLMLNLLSMYKDAIENTTICLKSNIAVLSYLILSLFNKI